MWDSPPLTGPTISADVAALSSSLLRMRDFYSQVVHCSLLDEPSDADSGFWYERDVEHAWRMWQSIRYLVEERKKPRRWSRRRCNSCRNWLWSNWMFSDVLCNHHLWLSKRLSASHEVLLFCMYWDLTHILAYVTICSFCLWSRDSSVGISRVWVRFTAGAKFCSSPHRPASQAHPDSFLTGTSGYFPGVKQPEHEADHTPSNSEVQIDGTTLPFPHTHTCPRLYGVANVTCER
jgi:hypothetical protein